MPDAPVAVPSDSPDETPSDALGEPSPSDKVANLDDSKSDDSKSDFSLTKLSDDDDGTGDHLLDGLMLAPLSDIGAGKSIPVVLPPVLPPSYRDDAPVMPPGFNGRSSVAPRIKERTAVGPELSKEKPKSTTKIARIVQAKLADNAAPVNPLPISEPASLPIAPGRPWALIATVASAITIAIVTSTFLFFQQSAVQDERDKKQQAVSDQKVVQEKLLVANKVTSETKMELDKRLKELAESKDTLVESRASAVFLAECQRKIKKVANDSLSGISIEQLLKVRDELDKFSPLCEAAAQRAVADAQG